MTQIWEGFDGRREVISESAEVVYFVRGEGIDESDVKAKAQSDIPSTYAGLELDDVEVAERINAGTWKVVARYKKPDNQSAYPYTPTPDNSYTFDTGSETQRITQSLETVGKYGPKASNDLKGAIGWDGEEVKGVDVRVPAPTWTETHWFSDDDFTASYRRTLLRMAFKTNNASWRGWSTGEVLFLGATCNRRGDDWDDPWEVTYKFAIRENRTGIEAGEITGIAKKGWEYMWVQYAKVEDTATKQVVKKPVAVYVEKVYYSTDFADLDID